MRKKVEDNQGIETRNATNHSLPYTPKAVSIYFRNIDSYLCKALKTEVNLLNRISYLYLYFFVSLFYYINNKNL